MIRGLIRLFLVVVLLVAAGAFFFGYRWADLGLSGADGNVGTGGIIDDEDKARARAAGAQIGETVAAGADQAQRAAADGSVTAKIKAKMALDDAVTAGNIDVDTNGTVVTLSGRVGSEDERQRAVRLARETEGVTSVVDRLTISK
jgi:hyperosmotically inducible periplasmic protein